MVVSHLPFDVLLILLLFVCWSEGTLVLCLVAWCGGVVVSYRLTAVDRLDGARVKQNRRIAGRSYTLCQLQQQLITGKVVSTKSMAEMPSII